MRNFEQRMAEIHRRSEKILKARARRRKNILIACVPLVLCATVFSVLVLPGITPVGEPNATDPVTNGLTAGTISESLTCAVVKIEVTGPDTSRTYTAAEDIRRITDGISACREEEPQYSDIDTPLGAVSQYDGQVGGTNQVQAEAAPEGYTVAFITGEGTGVAYRFAGNMLTDLSTGQIYPLTQKQAEELRDLLGISGRDIS